jgi:hypothetical protein
MMQRHLDTAHEGLNRCEVVRCFRMIPGWQELIGRPGTGERHWMSGPRVVSTRICCGAHPCHAGRRGVGCPKMSPSDTARWVDHGWTQEWDLPIGSQRGDESAVIHIRLWCLAVIAGPLRRRRVRSRGAGVPIFNDPPAKADLIALPPLVERISRCCSRSTC